MTQSLQVRLDVDQLEHLADLVAERLGRHLNLTTVGPYVTVEEAADLLRCKPQRVRDLLSARRLATHKEGRRTLLRRDEVLGHVREAR